MSYRVEISGGPFARERQDELARILIIDAGISPEEAVLHVSLVPCVVGPLDARTRNRLLGALDAADFDADIVTAETAPPAAYTPPAYTPPYAEPEAPRRGSRYTNGPETFADEPPPPPPAPAPERSSNTLLIAIVVALVVLVAGLGITLLTGGDRPQERVSANTPGTLPGEPVATVTVDNDEARTPDEPTVRAPRPPSDAAEYRLGYSPNRGVNWDVFQEAEQVRTSAVPNGVAIPIRDAPSARHGDALDEVPYSSTIRTTGCLVRRDDGGRWCQVGGDRGWIYDLYLVDGPAPRRAPAAPQLPSKTPADEAAAANAPAFVVMGSYRPGDEAGLRARYAQAQLAGVEIETGRSENYGMNPGYIVIISGPYERSQANRVLERVRPHVLDAFLRAVR